MGEKATQGCCKLFWTNPGSSTLQNCRCTATYLPSTGQCWKRKDKLSSSIRLASHQAGLDTWSFYCGGWEWGGPTWAETRSLLDNAGHRITRCNVNYASLCRVSWHICQVILLVTVSLELKVKSNACHWSFIHFKVAQLELGPKAIVTDQTQKWHSPIDSNIWIHQCLSTSKSKFCVDTRFRLGDLTWWMARESKDSMLLDFFYDYNDDIYY